LISGLGAWAINPGLFARGSADLSGYTAKKTVVPKADVPSLVSRNLSIDQAYNSIPHQRTIFRTDLAAMPDDEAVYLSELFLLTDAGVVERVYQQTQYRWGNEPSLQERNYGAILERLAALPTPEKLLLVEALIFEAIGEQQDYLRAWGDSRDPRYFCPRAPFIQSTHKKLIAAYNELMRLYAHEPPHNKQAFFDHLCALDFI
jgi:hypothetical protein